MTLSNIISIHSLHMHWDVLSINQASCWNLHNWHFTCSWNRILSAVFVSVMNTSPDDEASSFPQSHSSASLRQPRCSQIQGTTHCTCEPGFSISGRENSVCTGALLQHRCHQTHSRNTLFISGQRLQSHLKRPMLVKLKTQSLPLFLRRVFDGKHPISISHGHFILHQFVMCLVSVFGTSDADLFSRGTNALLPSNDVFVQPARSCMFSPRHRWV